MSKSHPRVVTRLPVVPVWRRSGNRGEHSTGKPNCTVIWALVRAAGTKSNPKNAMKVAQ
jgi:hypothetical protein